MQVCEIVKEAYADAYLTAHFEVGAVAAPAPKCRQDVL